MFHVKHQQSKLSQYKHLLAEYHGALDLVSPKALEQLNEKLSDSLKYSEALAPFIAEGATLLDIGSGAGLPGIPIAVALPQFQVHLVERRSRRATFLKIVKSKLGLNNVSVHTADVANLRGLNVSFVTALAVGSFSDLYCLTRHLHAEEIILLSRKGKSWPEEIRDLRDSLATPSKVTLHSETSTLPLSNDGTLVTIRLTGGLACQS